MALDDGTQTGGTRSLGVSSGEFQAVRPTYDAVPALVAAPAAETAVGSAAVPNLHYVFDDPNDGESGRDRMLVHGLWELLLALAIAGVGFALAQARTGALGGAQLRDLLVFVSVIGLLGIATAFSLRAAVPNLAVGGAAAVAGYWVATNATSDAWLGATAVALGICAAAGLVQGLIVVWLHVPAWAVSLGVLFAAHLWVQAQPAGSASIDYDLAADAYLWFAGVAGFSVVACLFGLAPKIRRGFARYRPVADPARRRSRGAGVVAVLATTVSMTVGGLAGVLIVLQGNGLDQNLAISPELTVLGLGAALLGGTSAFGRRGGIFGTIFAACLIALVTSWLVELQPRNTNPALWVAVGAIGVGLVATRLVERFGRPVLLPPSDDDESWMPRVHSLAPTSRPWQPAPSPTGGLWSSDEGWGDPPR